MAEIAEEKVESQFQGSLSGRLFAYMKPYTFQMVLSLILVLLITCFELVRPVLIGHAIDIYIEGYGTPYAIVEESDIYFRGEYLTRDVSEADRYAQLINYEDDYYYFDEVNTTLIGERTGKVFHLCDPIRVRVTGANKDEGTVDFTIVKTKKEKGKKKSKAKTSQRNERATRRVDQRLKKAKAKTSSFEPFMKKKNKRRH